MRPQPIKRAVVLLGCFSVATTTLHAAEWNGSYSANGQCFCVGELPAAMNATIVPTPIGGQTVAQVCARIGSGPALSKVEGLFNYPVYPDAQCGNGPFTDVSQNASENCLGTLDGNAAAQSQTCQPAGSSWDLKSAFSKAPAVAAASPVAETIDRDAASDAQASNTAQEPTSAAGLLNKPVVTTLSIEPESAEGVAERPLKATVIRSASTAARDLPEKEPLPPFTGKNVRIDGQRYLQAREGVDASGGEPGSRIILDGLVFLRDDGSIVPTDLYRVQPQTVTARKPDKAAVPAARATDTDVEATNRQITREKKRIQTLAAERDAQAKAAAKAEALAQANARAAAEVDEEALMLAKRRLEQEAAERARQQALINQASSAPSVQAMAVDDYQPDDLDAKAARNTRPYRQARIAIPDSPLSPPDTTTQTAVDEAAKQVGPVATDTGSGNATSVAQSGFMSALRLPNNVRASSRDFSYLEALPASFDVGGNGLVLEGSAQSHARVQYMGRIGVTATYRELMVGAGYYLTPRTADRLTVVLLAGVEYGSFELTDDQDPSIAVDFDDSGVYLGAATRFVANHRFELKAGVGYSTFFEGDAMVFGGGYYHITPRLDLVSRFELGDNDLLGIGVRFYY